MRRVMSLAVVVAAVAGAWASAASAESATAVAGTELAQSTYPAPPAPPITVGPPGQTYYSPTGRYYPAPSSEVPAPSSYGQGIVVEPQPYQAQPQPYLSQPQRYYPEQPYYGGTAQPYQPSARYYSTPRRSTSMAPLRAPTPEEQAILAWLPEHTQQAILSRLTVDQTVQGILKTMVLNRLVLDYAESRNLRWDGHGFLAEVRPVDSYDWVEVEYDPVTETYRKIRDLY
jgi:hypothetical protein